MPPPLARRLMSSLQAKVIASCVAFVFVAAILMGYGAALLVSSGMEPAIGTQHFRLMRSVGQRLDSELERRVDDLRAMGQALLPLMPAATAADLRERMLLAPALSQHFWSVGVLDAQGNLLASLRSPGGRKVNVAQRPYFQQAMKTRRPVISDPLRGSVTGKAMVVVTVPIIVEDEVKFVVSGGIDLDGQELRSVLLAGSDVLKGDLIVVGGNGILITHPDPALVMRPLAEAPEAALLQAAAANAGGSWSMQDDGAGRRVVLSRVPLRTANWTVFGAYSDLAAFPVLLALRNQAALAALGLALAAGLVGWLLAYRVIGPLRALRLAVAATERDPAASAALRSERPDEIGELSNQFLRLIMARDASEGRLLKKKAFLRTLLAGAPDAVILCDPDGKVAEWNLQAQSIFGWSAQEALGRHIAELIFPGQARAVAGGGLDYLTSLLGQPVNGRAYRLPAVTRDGAYPMVELSLAPIETEEGTAMLAFVRDVTQQIDKEARLAVSERRLQMVADNVPALIAYLDSSRRFVFSNAQYQRVLGVDPAGMPGRHLAEVLGPDFYAQVQEQAGLALLGQDVHFEICRTDGARTRHFMADFIADKDAAGSVRGFYSLMTDISERKAAELRQAASEQRAAAASQAKSEFVANISHEIRTPMNAVLGVAQLLENTPLREDQRDYLNIIRGSGLSLIAILNDVLDFSKIESGRMAIECERLDIETVLDGAAALMSAHAASKEIEVLIGIGASTPRYIMGDAVRLQQVVANLVSNAIKFTSAGQVALQVEAAADGRSLLLRVRDSGIGIAPELHEVIFDSFAQADSSTTRNYGGTGLGLTITRRLVHMMGGTLALDSAAGRGATFEVTLPLRAAPGAPPAPALEGKVLLVDDSALSREFFAQLGAYCACPVLCAAPAQAAAGWPGLDLAGVSHVLLAASQQANAASIERSLRANGLPAVAALQLIGSPYQRQALARLGGAVVALQQPLLPRLLRQLVSGLPAPDGAAARDALRLQGLRILLVEDNQVNQIVLRGMLAGRVAQLETVSNGAECVALFRTGTARFDVVLMDVQMPVMDGLAATRILRGELAQTLPIIALSAGVFQAERAACQEAGMNGFLPKPLVLDDLLALLCQLPAVPAVTPPAPCAPSVRGAAASAFAPAMLQAILERAPDQLAQLEATLHAAVSRTQQELAQLEQAVLQHDARQANKLLHHMRGGLGSLGAAAFAEAALAAQHGLAQRQDADIGALRQHLQAFAAQATAWLAERRPALQTGAPPARTRTVGELRQLLASHDFSALDVFDQLRPQLEQDAPLTALVRLECALGRLDFDGALACLESMATPDAA